MKKCSVCKQALDSHCDGCCEDVRAGLKVKKFCGKKGNKIHL